MQTAPLASYDMPTLPSALLPARAAARPARVAVPKAHAARPQRSLVLRLLVDFGLLVQLAFLAGEGLLGARAVLVMLGGNPSAEFSSFVLGATAPLVVPFAGVFQGTQLVGGQTVDATAILAIVVYWIAARLIETLIKTLARL